MKKNSFSPVFPLGASFSLSLHSASSFFPRPKAESRRCSTPTYLQADAHAHSLSLLLLLLLLVVALDGTWSTQQLSRTPPLVQMSLSLSLLWYLDEWKEEEEEVDFLSPLLPLSSLSHAPPSGRKPGPGNDLSTAGVETRAATFCSPLSSPCSFVLSQPRSRFSVSAFLTEVAGEEAEEEMLVGSSMTTLPLLGEPDKEEDTEERCCGWSCCCCCCCCRSWQRHPLSAIFW